MRNVLLILFATLVAVTPAQAQQLRYEDVVRNLRNPDAEERLAALKLLRESRHLDAIEPIAPLVVDPMDGIQLAAIDTELSFYLVNDVPARKRVALIVEVRNGGRAETAFASGPLAVWPRPVPGVLLTNLLAAIDDENQRVRIEALYTFGAIAPPAAHAYAPVLIKALDHYDPAIRAGAARVIGRLKIKTAGEALIKAVNDSQQPVRFAAMRALGEVGEEMAIRALTEQLDHYRKGEGAWSALDALARIAHPSSVPLFTARLADKDPYLRRAAVEGIARAKDASSRTMLESAVSTDPSDSVRAAMAFALERLGGNYIARLANSLESDKLAPQIAAYFLELGPPAAGQLAVHLNDPSDAIRGNVATILGAIGGPAESALLMPLLQDRNADVRLAAERAVERISMRAAATP
jgi:HEAT repeat protein